MLSNTENIKEDKEAFEDEINVDKDVEDAVKHDIEKIQVEICLIVENTVSKCSVLTKSLTSTQSPPQSSQGHVQQHPQHPHPHFHSLQMLPQYSQSKLYEYPPQYSQCHVWQQQYPQFQQFSQSLHLQMLPDFETLEEGIIETEDKVDHQSSNCGY